MRIEKIYFEAEDGVELAGLLHTSEKAEEHEVIISVHGMGSNCFKKRDDIIAKKMTDNGISYFSFNNRGQGIINTFRKNGEKILQGTVFEDVEESYNDIVGAIKHLKSIGYTSFHIQGHSLGSTKTVYTYNRLKSNNENEILNSIKSVILLSLVDLIDVMNYMILSNPETDIVKMATEKELEGDEDYIIETNTPFMPYVSTRTFLRYYKYNGEINFARYSDKTYAFDKLNNINVPLFMRWGNNKELISLPADEVVNICKSKINNERSDIDFIDGATHNYIGKEDILAGQILNFIKSNWL